MCDDNIIVLEHKSGAICRVSLWGGHVLSYDDASGKSLLFMSSKTVSDGSKPWRGGIPVIFPQFGSGKLIQHGFARRMKWTLCEPVSIAEDDSVVAKFLF